MMLGNCAAQLGLYLADMKASAETAAPREDRSRHVFAKLSQASGTQPGEVLPALEIEEETS